MAKTDFQTGFGYLARDADGTGVPLQTATAFSTRDATGTPVPSPLAYSGTTIYTLVIPDDAIQLILYPTTDLRVSDEATVTRYDLVTAGSKEAYPVALMQNVYVRRQTADGTLYFRFERV